MPRREDWVSTWALVTLLFCMHFSFTLQQEKVLTPGELRTLVEQETKAVAEQLRHKVSDLNNAFQTGKITLNVGGEIFTTTKETLVQDKGSLLAEIFTTGRNLVQGSLPRPNSGDREQWWPIDRDGRLFHHVLNWLRFAKLDANLSPEDAQDLLVEARYYVLSSLENALEVKLGNIAPQDSEKSDAELKKQLEDTLGSSAELLFQAIKDEIAKEQKDKAKAREGMWDRRAAFVTMQVGDRSFWTTTATICGKAQPSLLSAMLATDWQRRNPTLGPNPVDCSVNWNSQNPANFFFDRDGTHFHHILNWLRTARLSASLTAQDARELLDEAKYYHVPDLQKALEVKLKM